MPRHRTIPRVCQQCGSEFLATSGEVNRGHALFCGRACRSVAMPPPHNYPPIEARFWAKVDKSEECWIWTGSRQYSGYGRFGGSAGHPVGAHRFAYELTYGPIPDGLFVCHRCDNPPCVRPDHLFLGTVTDNNRDTDSKGRTSHGEAHPSAKLSDQDVRDIRRLAAEEQLSSITLGRRYEVNPRTIRSIVAGKKRRLS